MNTLICLILDRSGSMGGREDDVVNGVNAFITEQKKLPDPADIVLVRFDSEEIERFRPKQPLAGLESLSRAEYQPRGGTPLCDAVGQTMTELEKDWESGSYDRGVLVITTDGQENASKTYTKAMVKEMVEAAQESGLWAIIYLGANVDAFTEAAAMGVSAQNTAAYMSSSLGIMAAHSHASVATSNTRTTGSTFAANLGGTINEDATVTKRETPRLKWKKTQPPT